jgi:hypothetical protein
MTVLQFKKPAATAECRANLNNGEVWTCESFDCRYVGDVEYPIFQGFDVIHMTANGDSFVCLSNHRSLAEAETVALWQAEQLNAVFVPSSHRGRR